MLVLAWEAMDAAIPRLEASENIAAFSVAMVASPHIEQNARESILSNWRELIEKGMRALSQPVRSTARDSGEIKFDPKGLDRPLREVIRRVKTAFGRDIWE